MLNPFSFCLNSNIQNTMKVQEQKDAYLMLEDGTWYKGIAVGKIGTTSGEICFNTGMTGYQEIYTDPSYYGQIIVNTTSHIGNYGVKVDEQESAGVKFSGLVCRNFSDMFSRYDGDSSLQTYFENNNIVGISDIDTRELVSHIRSTGATMNAVISSEILDIEKLKGEYQKLSELKNKFIQMYNVNEKELKKLNRELENINQYLNPSMSTEQPKNKKDVPQL